MLPRPPLLAYWHPHVGWGTPLAILSLLLGVRLQRVVAVLPWRRLLLAGWMLNLAWMCSLALVDGLRQGWIEVLLDPHETFMISTESQIRGHSCRALLISLHSVSRSVVMVDMSSTSAVSNGSTSTRRVRQRERAAVCFGENLTQPLRHGRCLSSCHRLSAVCAACSSALMLSDESVERRYPGRGVVSRGPGAFGVGFLRLVADLGD